MIIKLKRAVLCWLGLHYDVEYTYDVWGMWGRQPRLRTDAELLGERWRKPE